MSMGAKFQRGQDTAAVAKCIRQDIKAAQKAGELPSTLKTSVRISRFSGGSSITIQIESAPVQIHDARFTAFNVAHKGHRHYEGERYTSAARALLKKLEGIAAEYRRDESDSQVDYFNCNFYLHCNFDYSLERQDQDIQESYFQALAA